MGATAVQISAAKQAERQQRRCGRCGGLGHDAAECPIPAAHDPAREKMRLIQGGCCGQVRRAD